MNKVTVENACKKYVYEKLYIHHKNRYANILMYRVYSTQYWRQQNKSRDSLLDFPKQIQTYQIPWILLKNVC